jgi:serine/threonine protein kinase
MQAMALASGTHLGPYEISGQIGEGGMGEVYRATDTKLGREVAIKILPGALAEDADRLDRFEREAKLLAALHHAHIASVFSLDQHDGTRYLAMELVAGETLEQKLKSGALPVEDALEIGLQIASALEAAHEKGVVHRDLKPANIMLTPDGVVKVLDFGLAKAFSSEPNAAGSAQAPLHSPALSLAMTQQGLILGTAGYMSPEQASGQATDQRADIWAFGVVLYEMLTGLPLFRGESVPHILADVLRTEPDWDRLPKRLHPRIRLLLEHCLRKKPRSRYHSIADVRIDIEEILGDPRGVTAASATPDGSSEGGRRGWIGAFAAAVIVAIALAVPALEHLRESRAPLPTETRLDIATPPTPEPFSFALSPEGSRVAYVAFDSDGQRRLWLRELDSTTAEALPGTEQASQAFWSPDGRSLGFFAASEMKRLDLVGGTPRTLAKINVSATGTWGADDVIVYNRGPGLGLSRVSATGGEVGTATDLGPGQTRHGRPHFLPDGRRFVFQVGGTPETSGIYLGSLDDDSVTKLTSATATATGGAEVSPEGLLFWIDDGRLLAQPLDLEQSRLTGQPITVAARADAVSIAAGGRVAYRAAADRLTQLQWFSRSGEALGTVGDPAADLTQPRVAPDGRRIAFVRGGQVWIQDGIRASQLTFNEGSNASPVWSPDGDRLVFGSTRSGQMAAYQTGASGVGDVELVAASTGVTIPTSWSPDGRFVLFLGVNPEGFDDGFGTSNGFLGVVSMDDEHRRLMLDDSKVSGGVHGVFSPDGHWIAFHGARSGTLEIWLRRFVPPGSSDTAASGQWQVSTAGGIFPAWSADGSELYYLNPEGALMAVTVDTSGDTPVLGEPERLFETHVLGGGTDRAQGRQYDVGPDGRFLINIELDSDVEPITLIQNFNPDAYQ